MDNQIVELAWAAGFFEGEGSVVVRKTGNGRNGDPTKRAYLIVSIGQADDPYTLQRFRDAVGLGFITGPYNHSKKKPIYRYTATGLAAWAVCDKLNFYLSSQCVKRKKMNRLLAEGAVRRDKGVIVTDA